MSDFPVIDRARAYKVNSDVAASPSYGSADSLLTEGVAIDNGLLELIKVVHPSSEYQPLNIYPSLTIAVNIASFPANVGVVASAYSIPSFAIAVQIHALSE